ncbi:MAG: hypothetical protein ACLSUZ_06595 [Bifidobacterium pseudocatenulatum]
MDGTTEVVKIVRAEVHKMFGPNVTLAPLKAGGRFRIGAVEQASPEEQSKIDVQLAQERLKSATLLTANLGTAASLESSGKEPAVEARRKPRMAVMQGILTMRRVTEPLRTQPLKTIVGGLTTGRSSPIATG